MFRQAILSAMLVGTIPVCVGETGEHTRLWGTWAIEPSASSSEKWILQEDAGSLQLTHVQGGEKRADLKCNTMGRDCKVKIDGRDATVSFYFNGPVLVQWEKQGNKVERRRFRSVDDGSTLEVETTSIVPNGKSEAVRLKRTEPSATVAAASK